MPAAAKRKPAAKPKTLRLHTEPHSEETPDTAADIVVRVAVPVPIKVSVWVEHREESIDRGEPIQCMLTMPDYESINPAAGTRSITVHLDALASLGESLLKLAEETARLGILPEPEEG